MIKVFKGTSVVVSTRPVAYYSRVSTVDELEVLELDVFELLFEEEEFEVEEVTVASKTMHLGVAVSI